MTKGEAIAAALLAAAVTCCGGQQESDRSGRGTGGQIGRNAASPKFGAGAGGEAAVGGEAGAGGEAGEAAGAGYPELEVCEWTQTWCHLQMAVGIGTAEHLPCEVELPADWFRVNPNDMRVGTDCDLLTPSHDDATQGWTYDSDRRVVVIRGADCDRVLAGEVERIDVAVCGEPGIAAAPHTGKSWSPEGAV